MQLARLGPRRRAGRLRRAAGPPDELRLRRGGGRRRDPAAARGRGADGAAADGARPDARRRRRRERARRSAMASPSRTCCAAPAAGSSARACAAADGPAQVCADLVIGADGRRSRVARAVGARTTDGGTPRLRHPLRLCLGPRGPRLPLALRPRRRRGRDPDQRRPACGLRRHVAGALPQRRRHAAGGGDPHHPRGGPPGAGRGGRRRRLREPSRSASPASPATCAQPFGPGWALVGDAGYFKDPITAHGITDALRDAELLARAVRAGTDAALVDYAATRDALSRPLLAATDALAALDWSFAEAKALHQDRTGGGASG